MSKNFDINFKYKERKEKIAKNIDKWAQLDSIFHKKNIRINFNDELFDETKNNSKNEIQYSNNFNNKNDININLQYLIHPISDEFDKFIDDKIEILEKLKDNTYKLKEELINKIENNNNLNLMLSKYKKEEESIIKSKNEPIYILNNEDKNDLDDIYEFNKMKNKKYFFNKSNNDYDTELGNRNKMRLNNILNKIKKEKPKKENQIISNPNKFNLDKSDNDIKYSKNEENKDYFDTILEEIKNKKNK